VSAGWHYSAESTVPQLRYGIAWIDWSTGGKKVAHLLVDVLAEAGFSELMACRAIHTTAREAGVSQ